LNYDGYKCQALFKSKSENSQIMYTKVSKSKNDKIKSKKERELLGKPIA
jgi:hypothetical protein